MTTESDISAFREDIREVKSSIDKMEAAIIKLAVLEERHASFSSSLERVFSFAAKLEARIRDLEQNIPIHQLANVSKSLDAAVSSISKLNDRVNAIELAQPIQTLTSKWVLTAMGFGFGILASFAAKSIGLL